MTDEQNTIVSDLDELEKAEIGDSSAEKDAEVTDTEEDGLDDLSPDNTTDSTPKADKRKETEDNTVNSWVNKINNGTRTLEELRANEPLNKWIGEKVEQRIAAQVEQSNDLQPQMPDIRSEYEKIKREERYKQTFDEVKGLPYEYRSEVAANAKKYISNGMPQENALQLAYDEMRPRLSKDHALRREKASGGVAPMNVYTPRSGVITIAQLAGIKDSSDYARARQRIDSGELKVINE